ncbi:metalloregulator ArsR/SmtB family transcription factor [Oryzomicrobium sp.]|uniref:ArsR/SmtB family transcription factor n=1 Tax=Oryzomicrobium sp. TaxID=1911578 RepID=UPI0025FB74CC|nr:metalloregulator ArsR/SmtB family transcription factor [Oryzomicrobium sp.]MCE1244192.1 metalloregulator ArsR/SmtB family transcription factor [Oryzomicrobium sp.]
MQYTDTGSSPLPDADQAAALLRDLRPNAELAARLLKAMAHEERLLILCRLLAGECSAGELARASALSQSAFSQHLTVLRGEGLVKSRRQAQAVFYSLARPDVADILYVLKRSCGA